jgi:hypothetical protein
MVCTVCAGDRFVRDEYRMSSGTAPALRCTKCGTLNLDELATDSDEERASVSLAKAARAFAAEPSKE